MPKLLKSILPSLVLGAAALSGCQTVRDVVADPVVVEASEYGITYRFGAGLSDDARRAAGRHCARYNRKAELDRVVPGGGDERTAIYRCI